MSGLSKVLLSWFGRLKNLQVLALIIASPVLTAISLVYLYAVIYGPWGSDNVPMQLELIRDGMMYVHVLLLVCIMALTSGLVRSISLNIAGKAGMTIDLADEHDSPTTVMQNVKIDGDMTVNADPVPEPDARPIGREE